MLRLEDRWVWDWWMADTGSEYHIFYLQAPRSLGVPVERHHHATVGHAVSADLRTWRVLDDALVPGRPGSWDGTAIWTGSTLRHADIWYTFYTGVSTADADIQRIGLATSPDLSTWTRDPANPIIEADGRWYELRDPTAWRELAWRDPWVLPDPNGEGYHALITARAAHGPPDGRGVIAHAWSADLRSWEVRPPLTEPGEFGHLEVPQVAIVEDVPVLLFSCATPDFAAQRRARRPDEASGTFLVTGDSLLGPWNLAKARLIPVPDLYSARIVQDRAGEWQVMGFYDGSQDGDFVGELSDPIPLRELDLP